ncbi:hypothetical protein K1T71_005379 [Dendrolimus kikuchii]|uniref:Uncharacterized protein n=1 Tax=Dendrolimus kikuchii TaxID=765133 RepID=A0ACC1D3V1_9NEOP|nr:hypothetical protein K1T71_005379 [Dendrolimus kikuchii]
MLTSSNQYLRPDYLSPLPTTEENNVPGANSTVFIPVIRQLQAYFQNRKNEKYIPILSCQSCINTQIKNIMFKTLVLVVAALVACQGNVLPEEIKDARNTRSFNSYFYFEKQRPLVGVPITNMNTAQLEATNFDEDLNTVFIIHGHSGSAFNTLNPLIRDSLFRNIKGEDVNVIVVDWSVFAGQAYASAVIQVPQVGRALAQYITEVMMGIDDFTLSKVHFVGFGLGAHIAGVAGRQLGRQVQKITACQGNVLPEEIKDARNTRSFNSYFYFDKQRPLVGVPITNMNTAQLEATNFDEDLNTVFIIHGHSGSAFNTLNPLIRDSLFRNIKGEDVNVIVVDWSVFAGQAYASAVIQVPQVGRALAQYITEVMMGIDDFTLSKVHFVGFGLGAHIAGVAGRQLGGQVQKITGLDPSGNQWGANSDRLTRHDAVFVEVIHTDTLGVLSNGIGEAIGHLDFFVNGLPAFQPGCTNNHCNHNRAYELFAASLTHGNLIGNSCSTMQQVTTNTCPGSRLELGNMDLVKFGSGIYRVNTVGIYPYRI